MNFLSNKAFPVTGARFEKNNEGTAREGIFIEKYRNMTYEQRRNKSALLASNYGRCLWVQQFLMTPVYTFDQKAYTI